MTVALLILCLFIHVHELSGAWYFIAALAWVTDLGLRAVQIRTLSLKALLPHREDKIN